MLNMPRPLAPVTFRTHYHRDHTVTLWNVYAQQWDRTADPSAEVLASLPERDRARVLAWVRP